MRCSISVLLVSFLYQLELSELDTSVAVWQVIERIRAVRGQTTLLVVDAEADRFFHEHRLPLSGRLPFVTVCTSQPSSDHDQQQQQQQRGITGNAQWEKDHLNYQSSIVGLHYIDHSHACYRVSLFRVSVLTKQIGALVAVW